MVFVDVAKAARPNDYKWAELPFYKDGEPYGGERLQGQNGADDNRLQDQDAGGQKDVRVKPEHDMASLRSGRPLWGITMLAAGSMRFRWNETNPNRDKFLAALCARYGNKSVVPLELIHSQKVLEARAAGDTHGLQGDGIITQNAALVPVVTAADCVPLYFYDCGTGAFGAAHSGWKGTGIAARVVQEMARKYGSKPRDILAAIGPHIHDCCYTVDGERAKYFCDNFGSDCVREVLQDRNGGAFGANQKTSQGQNGGAAAGQKYALSLLRANLNCLSAAGVLEENIVAAKNCTACDARFGSFRRQAAALDVPQEEKSRLFTTQAAFVIIE